MEEKGRLCRVYEGLRNTMGVLKIPTFITDAICAANFPWCQTTAREVLHKGVPEEGIPGRRWLNNREKPPTDTAHRESRLEFAKKYSKKDAKFWEQEVIMADCKKFKIRTSARQKLLGRNAHY